MSYGDFVKAIGGFWPGTFANADSWVFGTFQTFHFMGLCLLFGTMTRWRGDRPRSWTTLTRAEIAAEAVEMGYSVKQSSALRVVGSGAVVAQPQISGGRHAPAET